MGAARALPSLLLTAVLVAVAGIALGKPNFSQAGQYISGGYPTEEGVAALGSLFSWGLIMIVAITTVVNSIRVATEQQFVIRRRTQAIMFFALGVIILGIGAFRHSLNGYVMTCGDCQLRLTEAHNLVEGH